MEEKTPEEETIAEKVRQMVSVKEEKTNEKIKYVILILIILIIAALIWLLGNMFWFQPRDLGITYTNDDYLAAMEKIGIEVEFNGMNEEELEEYRNSGKKESFHDYEWEFSDYEQKTFNISSEEATALLNEIAPTFWWFDNLQVKVDESGVMEWSSSADIGRLKKDLYSDVADDITIPLPNKANIYSKGNLSISNNELSIKPDSFYVGALALPDSIMTNENISVMESYFPRIYTVVPGLEIINLSSENGEFKIDGIIPQRVIITQK